MMIICDDYYVQHEVCIDFLFVFCLVFCDQQVFLNCFSIQTQPDSTSDTSYIHTASNNFMEKDS